jgi:hypothetical protein
MVLCRQVLEQWPAEKSKRDPARPRHPYGLPWRGTARPSKSKGDDNVLKRTLDFLSSLWKAHTILILIGTIFISLLIWLRDKLLSPVQLPLIVLLVLGVLALYPLFKLVQWILLLKKAKPVRVAGLDWKPSRWLFGYPTPICPRCGCTIH